MSDISSLKVGDTAILSSGGWGRRWELVKISKVGKLHVTTEDGAKYQIRTGRRVGSTGYYSSHLYPFNQAEWDEYQSSLREQMIRRRLNAFDWNKCSLELAMKAYELIAALEQI